MTSPVATRLSNHIPRVLFDLRTRARSGVFRVGVQWLLDLAAAAIPVHLVCYDDEFRRILDDVACDLGHNPDLPYVTRLPRGFQILRTEPAIADLIASGQFYLYISPHYLTDAAVHIASITGAYDALCFKHYDLYQTDSMLRRTLSKHEWGALSARTAELESVHCVESHGNMEQRYTQLAMRDNLLGPGLCLAPSDTAYRDLIKYVPGAAPTMRIYRPYPFETNTRQITSDQIHAPYVLHIGRDRSHKALDILFDVARTQISGNGVPIRVLFAGVVSDVDVSRLRRTIEEERLDNICKVLNEVSTPVLRMAISAASALVSCSGEEGFSLPVAEALVLDVPIVSRTVVPALEPFAPAAHYFEGQPGLIEHLNAAQKGNLARPSALVPGLSGKVAALRTNLADVVSDLSPQSATQCWA